MLINNNKIVYLSPHTVTRYFDVLMDIGIGIRIFYLLSQAHTI